MNVAMAQFLGAQEARKKMGFSDIGLYVQVQVNLCQKLLFLHQLTHNMTADCSMNYHVLNLQFNKKSVIILWVGWCKNKSF